MKLTILGSSSAKPTPKRHQSGQVININEQLYLIDGGEGVQQQMFRYGINPLKLRGIFVSHLHADHVYGIFPLLSTMSLYGRKTAIKVYAPAPFGEMLECYIRYFGGDMAYEVEWVEVDCTQHQIIFENRTLEVWSLPLRHRLPTSGYLFREKQSPLNVNKFKIEKYALTIAQITAAKRGEDVELSTGETILNSELTYLPYSPRSYAYVSDTAYAPPVAERCKGVDLLYHEATYAAIESKIAKERGHSTTHQAAKIAAAAGAKRLLIGHFSSRYKDLEILRCEAREIFDSTQLALEGEEFTIERDNQSFTI
ncbi:MAG: ribonuclease Z [Rikenellaceae bacterium]